LGRRFEGRAPNNGEGRKVFFGSKSEGMIYIIFSWYWWGGRFQVPFLKEARLPAGKAGPPQVLKRRYALDMGSF
jgi:hypothetical protein